MVTVLHHARWFSNGHRRFKSGQLNIEESPRSGRPISATDEKNIKAVENLVVEDRRITIQEIAEILGILSGTV